MAVAKCGIINPRLPPMAPGLTEVTSIMDNFLCVRELGGLVPLQDAFCLVANMRGQLKNQLLVKFLASN